MQLKRLTLILISIISINTFAGEEDLYDFLWLDPDKSVYVLQNKVHPKDNSFYLDLGYMMNMTSTFQETNGAQIKAGYFLNEDWAIELSYISYSNSDNSTFDSVKVVTSTVPFLRRPISSSSIFAVWSPFYGKINTFNQIFYFDWSFGVGTGVYQMESNLISVQDSLTNDKFDTEDYTPIQLKTTFKFHINKSLHLGLEFLNTNFESSTPKNPNSKSWDQNNDLIFSIGASF
jgi:outer membrane beta-barrel protein